MSKKEKKTLKNRLNVAAQPTRSSRLLPDSVAQAKPDGFGEIHTFTVGHQFYREKLCKIKVMPISPIRKVLEAYKKIALCVTENDIFNLPGDFKKITPDNNYQKYKAGLTPDTEVCEFDAGDYRGFFFVDRSERIIQMIAVDNHPEDRKQRR